MYRKIRSSGQRESMSSGYRDAGNKDGGRAGAQGPEKQELRVKGE